MMTSLSGSGLCFLLQLKMLAEEPKKKKHACVREKQRRGTFEKLPHGTITWVTKRSEWKRFILQFYIFINLFISPTLCSAQDFKMDLICIAKQNWSFTGSFCGSSQVTVFINICPSCWENWVFLNQTCSTWLPATIEKENWYTRTHTPQYFMS